MKRARPAWALALFGLLALAGIAGLTALGIWQLERRVWKLDLIERVDARIHASPVPAPGPEAWASVSAASDEYRRVGVRGRFLNDREALVQAVSDLGGGFWVMTPLVTDRGFAVLVNRGFVPPDKRDPATRAEGQPQGEVSVTGLLRLTEPKGGFLRSNDPAAGRWYSRDVAAIAAATGLEQDAPYFIDADSTRNPGGWPVGGLTVVSFPNSHLGYALTWFALDLMLIGAVLFVVRSEMRRRRA
ncbi:SURF1 family protein [Azospirillum palustre]|uniref:SURF1 family protein n=1 Tax=Azospirillum palustre TaxID=2044885 RepID=UPI001FCE65C3|nr:SURF1 family protein [Azospirillum palustre]